MFAMSLVHVCTHIFIYKQIDIIKKNFPQLGTEYSIITTQLHIFSDLISLPVAILKKKLWKDLEYCFILVESHAVRKRSLAWHGGTCL